MAVAAYTKDPGATLEYGFDWGSWLHAGEIITASTWTVVPSQPAQAGDITVSDSAVVLAITTAWLQAGVIGVQYTASNSVATSCGREDTRSITLDMENR